MSFRRKMDVQDGKYVGVQRVILRVQAASGHGISGDGNQIFTNRQSGHVRFIADCTVALSRMNRCFYGWLQWLREAVGGRVHAPRAQGLVERCSGCPAVQAVGSGVSPFPFVGLVDCARSLADTAGQPSKIELAEQLVLVSFAISP